MAAAAAIALRRRVALNSMPEPAAGGGEGGTRHLETQGAEHVRVHGRRYIRANGRQLCRVADEDEAVVIAGVDVCDEVVEHIGAIGIAGTNHRSLVHYIYCILAVVVGRHRCGVHPGASERIMAVYFAVDSVCRVSRRVSTEHLGGPPCGRKQHYRAPLRLEHPYERARERSLARACISVENEHRLGGARCGVAETRECAHHSYLLLVRAIREGRNDLCCEIIWRHQFLSE